MPSVYRLDQPRSIGSTTLLALACTALLATVTSAQTPQAQDPDFATSVESWTTAPEFISPLVDHLPVVEGVPSPKAVLGHHVGAPRELTYYAQVLEYYRALAAASPRVDVLTIGETDEGREYVVVMIGSAESIRERERYRQDLARLADPRGLSEAEAKTIIGRAKPIYHFLGGLHSGETGPPEMLMELAYRLAAEDSPLINRIRDEVIVTLTPVADPDGRDRYVDWYYRHLIDIDDDRVRITGPPYWGRYVFHDNNRDINYSQVTFRALLEWYLEWHPPILHDLHESVPFLYTFSGQAPQNPTLDPILYGELPWFANFEMAQLTKYGMPGVWTHAFVDMWSPGYLAFMSSNHNGMIRMYETFGNGGATPMSRRLDTGGGPGQTSREWYRPSPPYEEVDWSMRNNTNYMQTAVLTALQLTSSFPEVVLENFYLKSRNSITSGETEAPFGYLIPSGQRDMTRVELLVNLLRRQGIEVGRAVDEVTVEEGTFPAGSYIVKRNQPYGRLAKTLLEHQEFPDDDLRTYDDTGWTMGLMLHTEVEPIADKAILDLAVEPVDTVSLAGTVAATDGDPAAYVIAHQGSTRMITLRSRLNEIVPMAAEAGFEVDGVEYPAGSFIVATGDHLEAIRERVTDAVEVLGLTGAAVAELPAVSMHPVDLPRLAVYSTWGNTQEVGWVRHALDQFEVAYDLVYKERVRAGDLRSDYDVILVPNQGRSGRGLVFDIESPGRPLAYTKTESFQFLGEYGESEDIAGGMGLEGVVEFREFLDAGGLAITLGAASYFPVEFGLTRTVDARRTSGDFYAPGPVVEAEVTRAAHPIFYGYTDTTIPVRYANGPLLSVPDERDRERYELMRFPEGEDLVMSGLMRGAGQVGDTSAIVELPVGDGRLLLFATNPCYRWQNHGEFNMLFNALLHHNDFPMPGSTSASAQ